MSKRLYFVAGEASGDTHGAVLLEALAQSDRTLRFFGRGGPRMKKIAGGEFVDWSDRSAVLGLWEVLKQYRYFRHQFGLVIEDVRQEQPDAVVLIDYPGFNLRLARALRRALPRLRIIYYISPQVWAWNRRRIPQMAQYLDLMLCIFPFEAELYNQSGLRTVFVGHPMLESLSAEKTSEAREPDLIAILPGSRLREIRKILPAMLQAAARIARVEPKTRFQIAAASPTLTREIESMVRATSLRNVDVLTDGAASLMQRAHAGMVASGTATLEAAFYRLPFVLVYRVAWLTYFAARLVVKVKYLGMPNVLAGREIAPEFIQHRATPKGIADALLRLMNDPEARSLMISEFDEVMAKLGRDGASQTAARAILEEM